MFHKTQQQISSFFEIQAPSGTQLNTPPFLLKPIPSLLCCPRPAPSHTSQIPDPPGVQSLLFPSTAPFPRPCLFPHCSSASKALLLSRQMNSSSRKIESKSHLFREAPLDLSHHLLGDPQNTVYSCRNWYPAVLSLFDVSYTVNFWANKVIFSDSSQALHAGHTADVLSIFVEQILSLFWERLNYNSRCWLYAFLRLL